MNQQIDKNAAIEKVVAYIPRIMDGKKEILVFEHDEHLSEAGIQVPAGTMDLSESPEKSVLREVWEESGLGGFSSVHKIDEYEYFHPHSQKIHLRHVFQLAHENLERDRWSHQVKGHGQDKGLHFHFYWMPISQARIALEVDFGRSLDLIRW